MKKLIILDFIKGEVHIYELPNGMKIDFDIEEFISLKGFSVNNCQWMVSINKKLSIRIH